ncbi:MAG TPA: hypothetical protein VIL51_10635 [Thermoleophilia bacterium]
MTRIDFENHFATADWFTFLRSQRNRVQELALSMPALKASVEDALLDLGASRIKAMDEAGIDVAILSLSAPRSRAVRAKRCA